MSFWCSASHAGSLGAFWRQLKMFIQQSLGFGFIRGKLYQRCAFARFLVNNRLHPRPFLSGMLW
jgi:hypothetical protein